MYYQNMGVRSKSILVGAAASIFIIVIFLIGFIYTKRQSATEKKSWKVYDKQIDYVTKDGQLIRDESRRRMIRILPVNYEEKNIEYKITSFSFTDNLERSHLIFDSIPEFTTVRLLPNSIDASKLWVLTFRSDYCTYDLLNPKDSAMYKEECKFSLYEFDLNSNKLIEKKVLTFWAGVPVRDVYFLTHDAVKNTVWMGVDHYISKGLALDWEKHSPDLVDPDIDYSGTDLISYDANTNQKNLPIFTLYWISGRFDIPHKTLAKAGRDGELYLIGECIFKCGDPKRRDEGVGVVQKFTTRPLPIFYYEQDLGSVRSFQITTDVLNNYVYVITNSFNQVAPSQIFRYDVSTGRSMHIGKQPTQEDDDLRGLDVIDGNLAIGSFNGLAVYNQALDNWKIIKQEDGIKSNNVEGVYGINGGGVCILHENDGASCLFEPLSTYIENIK